jgi:hypothetical protein
VRVSAAVGGDRWVAADLDLRGMVVLNERRKEGAGVSG